MTCNAKPRQRWPGNSYPSGKHRRIWQLDPPQTGWVISAYDCWMPGCYESPRAALTAFRFRDEVLDELQEHARVRCPEEPTITLADLWAARQRPRHKSALL